MSKGVVYMLMATVFLAIMQVAVKMLPEIPVPQIIFIRAVVSALLSFAVIRFEHVSLKGKIFHCC